MAEKFLLNCWYQAAWASEIEAGPLARTLLGVPIVLFKINGQASALRDQCPHRFAPLSAGKLEHEGVTCGYHGLGFGGDGQCIHNPHGPITKAMSVKSFKTVERHTAIWVWMGDAEKADPASIPDLSFIDETPETARNFFYIPTAAGYRLLTDNIMDLSHADYLHPATLGGMMTESKFRFFERDGRLVAEWMSLGCTAPGIFQHKIPSPQKADFWIEVAWQAPAVMVLSAAAVPTGTPRTLKDESSALHNMTPETATTAHYFMCGTRHDRPEDVALTEFLRGRLKEAFLNEDKPMLELQQNSIGDADFWSLKPILLRVDTAAVQVRRKLDELISSEHG